MRATFRWVNKDLLVSVGDDGAREAAEMIRERAKFRAPVDTGALRRSITVVRAGKLRYVVKTGVDYAGFVEFGTRHMAAQPFLGPALEEARRSIR